MNKQLSSPLSKAIRKALKPTISTLAVSTALLASSAWAYHGDQQTAFIFYNDNLLLAPTTIAPTIPAISIGDQPLSTSSCVDLGYVAPGSTITKKFTIASSETGAASGTVVGDFTYDSLSSITFTGGTEFRQSGSAQNATNLTSGIIVAPLCNTLGATTGGTTANPLKTATCLGIASAVTTAPTGAVGYFDIQFTAPSTPQIVKGRYMNVYTSTDPVVNPLSVQVSASIVSSLTPKVQVLDSSLAQPPAGVDVPNGTLTAINLTPAPLTSTSPPVSKNFSVKNLGAANLLLSPTTATCISSSGTTVAEFSVTPFVDADGADKATPASTTSVDTTIVPDYAPGCPSAMADYSKFTVTFTPPTVAIQTKYTCNVNFTSNDSGIVGTKFTFPVEATVNPPPPLKPEIDVYDGTKLIPSLDKVGIDFGTIAVGSPKQKTLTVKNPSGTNLNVFDFSSNLPNGFSLLNANYASTIPPGGSTNLIFQCDATTAGKFGASQDSCVSNPLGAGCALRIPSNDDDNLLWEFNGGGVENPYTIPFKCIVEGGASTNVSLNLTQPANGVVTSNTGGISCGTGSTSCTASYTPGASVSLTATADASATFSGWGGDCSGTTSPLTVTMDTAKNCTATFTGGGSTGNQVALTITTPTNGVVTGDKGGINCGTGGNTCTANYDPSTVVVLTTSPDNGATFKQWGGSCSGTTSPLSITMDTAKNCTATFETTVVTTDVTLTITKPTVGNIMSSAGGINCGTAGTSCLATYSKDGTVQLMGAADNMTLDTWTGDCSGSNNPLSVAMSQDKTCSATFKTGSGSTTQPTLTITQPTGGSVTGNPGGISCGASGSTCVASYTAGDVISLTAIPALGNTFTGWGSSCVGTTNPLSVTMDAAKTCTATFTAAGGNDPPPVTNQLLTINTPTGGKVTSDVGGISCGTNSLNCTANYTTGSIVRLTAMADTGATFASWGGNCTGITSPTVLTMDAAKTCSATFVTTGGGTCSSTNLPACTTDAACTSAGGTFVGGACTPNTTGTCSATSLSTCTTETSCGGAGGIFVSNACTVAPILSHPQKGVAALIDKATEQTFNVPAFFAAGASVNGSPFAPMVSVKASDVVDWAVNITVNPIHLGQSANVLFVIGVEPPSPTDPITGYSGNEDTQYFALDEGLNLFPVNLYAGPAEWSAEVDKMTAKPFKRVTLQSRMSFSLRKGTLAALVNGQPRARIYTFVGYALADGTIVYNGMPIMTTLE